jgi:hypothetical protein
MKGYRMNISRSSGLLLVALVSIVALPRAGEAKPDWATRALATDPKENATPCDWLEFHARALPDGDINLAYRCAAPVNFSLGAAYSVYLDTDGNRDTGYRGSDRQFPLGAEYLLQGATLYRYNQDAGYAGGTDWSWTSLGLVAHHVTDDWADFTLTADQLGVSTATVHIILVGDNTAADVGGNENDLFPDQAFKGSGAGRTIQLPMNAGKP